MSLVSQAVLGFQAVAADVKSVAANALARRWAGGGNLIVAGDLNNWPGLHWWSAGATMQTTGVARSGGVAGHLTLVSANVGDFFIANGNPAVADNHPKVQIGETYTFSVWIYNGSAPVGTGNIAALLKTRNAAGATVESAQSTGVVPGATWTQLTTTLTVSDPTSVYITAGLHSNSNDAGFTVRLDDLSMRVLDPSVASVQAMATDYAAFKDTTASIEELSETLIMPGYFFSAGWDQYSITNGAWNQTLFIAPFDCQIVSFDLVKEYTAIAASDTNYLRFQLNRYRAGAYDLIAEKTTKVTGGEAIAQKVPWSFDGITFDPSNSILTKGDAFSINFACFGTAVWRFPLCFTFRYVPYDTI